MVEREGVDARHWKRDENGVVTSTERDIAILDDMRKKATDMWPPDFRSCWQCNGAHEHFLSRNEYLIRCFDCGRIYVNGYDVTEWE